MKILVAMPVYNWMVPADTVRCLLNEKTCAHLLGDDLIVEFLPGCSHPAMGRNQLAKAFMESDCERLVFLDSDVTFDPGSLLKVAHYPVDFCGGVYRLKKENEEYPVGWIPENKELWTNELGLLEVAALPGGFMSLSRNVFETIQKAHPNRWFDHFGKTTYAYFEMPYKQESQQMFGEDGEFCTLWRTLNGKIYLDPNLTLVHHDFKPTPYKGNIGEWLKNRPKDHGEADIFFEM